jgi:hypothetical protein
MIVFDLKCDNAHVFEAWFGSSAGYEEQKERGLVECPTCGSTNVSKAIMAPNVGAKSNQKSVSSSDIAPLTEAGPAVPVAAPAPTPTVSKPMPEMIPAELQEAAEKFIDGMRKHVQDNCDYVGNEFAEEARKIHYGESEERGIYGEATADETAELLEEGVEILPLPGARRTDA